MKARDLPSSSPEQIRLAVRSLRFGENGPYDFSVGRGACVGVSGVSGIGKSLLLRAIADLDDHAGEVSLDGRARSSFTAPEWRRSVSLVPADSRWWHATVGEHLGESSDAAAVRNLVESFGFGVDALGWQSSRLSTGEKQRLSMIRALIREPAVLLLDEVGSALDSVNQRRLEAVVETFRSEGGAVLWISHSMEQLARVAGSCMVLGKEGLEMVAGGCASLGAKIAQREAAP